MFIFCFLTIVLFIQVTMEILPHPVPILSRKYSQCVEAWAYIQDLTVSPVKLKISTQQINPFLSDVPFLYPLKT